MQSYYDALGVSKNASASEVKRAFRKLASKHHPDRGGDTETMQKIQRAYDVLSDTDMRAKYDQYGEEGLSKKFDVDDQAMGRLKTSLHDLLSKDVEAMYADYDIIVHLRELVDGGLEQMKAEIKKHADRKKRLEKKLGTRKSKKTGEANFFEIAISEHLESVQRVLNQLEFEQKVVTRALELIDELDAPKGKKDPLEQVFKRIYLGSFTG